MNKKKTILYKSLLDETEDLISAAILGVIIKAAKEQKTIEPIKSQISISEDLKLSPRTISNKIKGLEEKDYFTHSKITVRKPIINKYFGYKIVDYGIETTTKFVIGEKLKMYI